MDSVHDEPTLDFSEPQPWWKVGQFRDTDDQRIERLRRSVQWWIRWRWWLFVLCVCIICFQIAFLVWVYAHLRDLEAWFGQQARGLVTLIAVALGFKFGAVFESALFGMVRCLDNFRTECLLLRIVVERQQSDK